MTKYDMNRAPIGSIDPDTDHYEWTLSNRHVDIGWEAGQKRAEENEKRNKNRHDKFGGTKEWAHTNGENDGLGGVFEVGVTEALGFNPLDPKVLTLFHEWPYPEDRPDVKGIYECRRLNSYTAGVTFFPKDVDRDAIIIAGIVDHYCKRGWVRAHNRIVLLGWNYPSMDKEFATQRGDRWTIPQYRMRPMRDLPLLAGAQLLAQPIQTVGAAA